MQEAEAARSDRHLIGCKVGSNSDRFAEKRFTYIKLTQIQIFHCVGDQLKIFSIRNSTLKAK